MTYDPTLPHTYKFFLAVNATRKSDAAQWFRNNPDKVEQFFGDPDDEKFAVVKLTKATNDPVTGPTQAWALSSWITPGQRTKLIAMKPQLPASWRDDVEAGIWLDGNHPEFDDWIAGFTPPMQRKIAAPG